MQKIFFETVFFSFHTKIKLCVVLGSDTFCLPTCLLPIIVSFSYIYISQGNAVTQLRCGHCGQIFNKKLRAAGYGAYRSILFWLPVVRR